jgi:hypothetical protein
MAILGFAIISTYQNCGSRNIYQAQLPEIGKPVTIRPSTVQAAQKSFNDYSNKLIFFSDGARPLNYDDVFTIRMFNSDPEPKMIYEFNSAQLKEMYKATNCSLTATQFLANASINDVLFCNQSLDLSQVNSYELEIEGKKKTATSYRFNFVSENDDLISLDIVFP